jgi:hypothetical protein
LYHSHWNLKKVYKTDKTNYVVTISCLPWVPLFELRFQEWRSINWIFHLFCIRVYTKFEL